MDLDHEDPCSPWASEGRGSRGHDVCCSFAQAGAYLSRGITTTGHHPTGVLQALGPSLASRIAPAFLPSTNYRSTTPLNIRSTSPSSPTSKTTAFAAGVPDGAEEDTMEYVKRPIRAATAPAAQRVYLTTFLLATTSLTLLFIAALVYPIFYYTYVPKKVVSVPIHLQYNAGLNPFGVTSITDELMLETAYDVSVELTLPRSPPNLDRGNFMVALFATKSSIENPAQSWTLPSDPYLHVNPSNVVFSSRRPILLPYKDPLVSQASRVLFLLWHMLHPTAEAVTLEIPMGELVEFRNQLPLSLLLDVQAGQTLQVYEARIELVARLTGVRWAMYNHRILSFVVCTTAFWLAEMGSMGVAWAVLAYCIKARHKKQDHAVIRKNLEADGDGGDSRAVVKRESEGKGSETEDNESAAPESYNGEGRAVKDEYEDERAIKEESQDRDASRLMEYGDEDGDGGEGTGSSYGKGKGIVRRRSSQQNGS
ncbi:putative adipose-regulatory protein-domain-containing protein [Xylariales sp. AK1849]|nr:putative adipose-regulatory protein-domain-containing protein [Xylariales sp. AK1849]